MLEELSRRRAPDPAALPPPPGEAQVDRYEIFHDVLGESVLEWCGRHNQEREKEELAERVRADETARRRARRARILRGLAVVLGVAVLALLVVLIPTLSSRSEANRKQAIERSRGLAGNALAQLSVDPERSLLLAIESVKARRTSEAHDALAAALAASQVRATLSVGQPRPCPMCEIDAQVAGAAPAGVAAPDQYIGHQQRLVFSSDRRTAAVIIDGRVRLWNIADGKARDVAGVEGATGVSFTPNGRSILISNGEDAALAPVSGPPSFRVLATEGGSAALSANGRYSANLARSRGGDTWAEIRRVADDTVVRRRRTGAWVSLLFSARDPDLVLICDGANAVFWHWRTGESVGHVSTSPSSFRPPASVEFSRNGDLVAAVDVRGRAHLWEVSSGNERFTRGEVVSLATLSPDGERLLTVEGQTATIWTTSGGDELTRLAGHTDTIADAAFSPDGTIVATASADGTVRVWDEFSGQQLMELHGHLAPVEDVAFSPDGRYVLSVGEDGIARLWEVTPPGVLRPRHGAHAVAMDPDGRRVAVISGGALRLWTPGGGKPSVLAPTRGESWSIAFSSADAVAVAGPAYRRRASVIVVHLDTGAVEELANRQVMGVAFDPAGERLVTISWSRIVVRDADSLRPLDKSPVSFDPSLTVATVSRDGRILLTDPALQPRIVERGEDDLKLKGGAEPTDAVTGTSKGDFSRDGRWVVAPAQRQAIVWDSRSGRVLMRLDGHTGPVVAAAFSDDGRRIVTGSADHTMRVCDARTGRSIAVLQGHAGAVTDVGFTPSGDEILSAGEDGAVRATPCYACRSTDSLMSSAASLVTRDLSNDERRSFLGETD